MLRKSGLFFVMIFGAFPIGAASAQVLNIKDQYGVYWVTPNNPSYGPGAILQGYMKQDGSQLYVKQAVCWPKVEPAMDKECKPTAALGAQSGTTVSIDITSALKALLDITGNGQYVKRATLKLDRPCIVELSVQQQMDVAADQSCLLAVKALKKKMDPRPLREKLKAPGKYLLIWQTTRALYADAVYEVEYAASAGAKLKTIAAATILGLGGNLSIKGEITNKATLNGTQMFVGLSPRYYEEWFVASNEDAQKINQQITRVASNQPAAYMAALEADMIVETSASPGGAPASGPNIDSNITEHEPDSASAPTELSAYEIQAPPEPGESVDKGQLMVDLEDIQAAEMLADKALEEKTSE
ncbi:MAG: hypothetical protein ACRECF_03295 [Methyloceanibacter sp.]